METYDVGSLPFTGDWERFLGGAKPTDQLLSLLYPSKFEEEQGYFDEKVVEGFTHKVQAGIDIPNYPQFRDMNQMFLDALTGIEKTPKGLVETGRIVVRPQAAEISEVSALRRHAKEIVEKTGAPLRLKVCVTGPYTLAATFAERRAETFGNLAEAMVKVVEANVFKGKYGGVELVFVDEPTFGLFDDPLLDFGQEGRESLLHAWEHVLEVMKAKNVHTGFHLHSTRDELFWDVRPVEILESHVEDPLYESPKAKERLERTDKFIKASITVTDFDALIRKRFAQGVERVDESVLSEKVGEAWNGMRKGIVNPLEFLEDIEQMRRRLRAIVSRFGEERVPYAGPECALRSFPTYQSALELLRRVSQAAHFL